jgi:hypothetical protein
MTTLAELTEIVELKKEITRLNKELELKDCALRLEQARTRAKTAMIDSAEKLIKERDLELQRLRPHHQKPSLLFPEK